MRLPLALAFTALVLCAAPDPDRAAAQDKVIGAIWELHARNPDTGKYEKKGGFRCTEDGRVFKDGAVVGTHKTINLETVEITITGAPGPKGNGTVRASRVSKSGSVWEGVHENLKGEKTPIRMFLKKD